MLLTYDLQKDAPLFEKYKEEEKKEEVEKKIIFLFFFFLFFQNLEVFNATFNLNISESQKKAKEQMVLPFMKAQSNLFYFDSILFKSLKKF